MGLRKDEEITMYIYMIEYLKRDTKGWMDECQLFI
jgi:hypothetical protein